MAIRHKIKKGIEVTVKDLHDNIHVMMPRSGWNTSFTSFSWFRGGTLERTQDHFKFIYRRLSLKISSFFSVWIIERSWSHFQWVLYEHQWTPDLSCVCDVDVDTEIHRHYVWNWKHPWNFVMECFNVSFFFINSALSYVIMNDLHMDGCACVIFFPLAFIWTDSRPSHNSNVNIKVFQFFSTLNFSNRKKIREKKT